MVRIVILLTILTSVHGDWRYVVMPVVLVRGVFALMHMLWHMPHQERMFLQNLTALLTKVTSFDARLCNRLLTTPAGAEVPEDVETPEDKARAAALEERICKYIPMSDLHLD